jgi:hypothetical protein
LGLGGYRMGIVQSTVTPDLYSVAVNPPHHKIAAEALVDEYRYVDEALAAKVTDEQLTLRAAGVSYQFALLIGLCAEPARVVSAAKAIAAKPERRALLLPLALVLTTRAESLANEVKKFLPEKMAADLANALDGKAMLSRSELNGLGDIRTVETVRSQLAKLFTKEEAAS